jgi:hypothetical protein
LSLGAAGDFAADGVCVVGAAVPAPALPTLRALPAFAARGRPGARAFSPPPEVAQLAVAGGLLADIATGLMGEPMRAVRILCFDKTAATNWAVPWHQDRTIAVAGRAEVPGFAAWSVKAGVHHVEPPEAILAGMVALRLSLDDCGPENGPLLAVSGSWRLGRVPAGRIKRHVEAGRVQALCANAGDVVVMRGLTIHASERAAQPGHRRVLHVDFSAAELPGGLQWAMA